VGAGLKAGAGAGSKLPSWFPRLPVGAQRIYLKSDAIDRLDLTANETARELARALMLALQSGAATVVERRAQLLIDELCRLAALSRVEIQVRNVRPRDTRGELHGLFYPRRPRSAATIKSSSAVDSGSLIVLWMRTAQRHDVVKPRTFIRTLMHEFAHYLDYAQLRLGDSPHTSGFFKRESFLMRALQLPALD
jgi:hypothetical protein